MFAVPGWSLGPLKREAEDASTQESRKSRKRKRKLDDGPGKRVGESYKAKSNESENSAQQGPSQGNGISNAKDSSIGPGRQGLQSPSSTRTTKSSLQALDSTSRQAQGDQSPNNGPTGLVKKKRKRRKSIGPTSDLNEQQDTNQAATNLTPMQAAMRQKLISARFRHLNQTLYTVASSEAQQLFKSNPTFFREYHAGFRQQVSSWPENPVDTFLHQLKERGSIGVPAAKSKHRKRPDPPPTGGPSPLPRTNGVCTVADLGCGDARLAAELQRFENKLSLQVKSFDLHSNSSLVTNADISQLPLENGAVNVAIFCLALMGTNWTDFIDEAWRVLHWKGELWIAEIKSRFARARTKQVDHSIGKKRKPQQKNTLGEAEDEEERLRVEVDGSESNKEQTDVSSFVAVLEQRGFVLAGHQGIDLSNKMFVRLHFTKSKAPTKGQHAPQSQEDLGEDDALDENSVLKPCLYKTR